MLNEATLRRVVRLVLESGKLPRRDPNRTWGGPASAPCVVRSDGEGRVVAPVANELRSRIACV